MPTNWDAAHNAEEIVKAKYTAEQIAELGKKGQAFKNPDGHYSFPIANKEDLANAKSSVGRAPDSVRDDVIAYINRRAKALGDVAIGVDKGDKPGHKFHGNQYKSLLSPKDQKMHWRDQIQKLQRIGKRAQSDADWMHTLAGTSRGDKKHSSFGAYAKDKTEKADLLKRAKESDAKAKQAANEMLSIAHANGDSRVAGKPRRI